MKCIFNLCNFKREEEYYGPYPPKRWTFAVPHKFSVAMAEISNHMLSPKLDFYLEFYNPQLGIAYYQWWPRGDS